MLDWCESLTSLQPHSAILWPPCGKSKPNLEQCKVQQNTLEKFSSDELGQPCLKVIRALLNAMKVQKIEQNILNVNNCQTSKWMSEDLFFSLWFNVISETVYWFLCVYVLSGWHFYRSQQKTQVCQSLFTAAVNFQEWSASSLVHWRRIAWSSTLYFSSLDLGGGGGGRPFETSPGKPKTEYVLLKPVVWNLPSTSLCRKRMVWTGNRKGV